MSYILDALKKSESERGHGAIPGVQTVHSSSINYHQQKKTIWPYILIVAIFLNIAVIAYFIYTQNNSTQSAAVVHTVQNHSTNNSTLANSPSALSGSLPSTQPRSNPVLATIEKAPVSPASVEPVPATPVSNIAKITTPPVINRPSHEKNNPGKNNLEKNSLQKDSLTGSALTPEKTNNEPLASPQSDSPSIKSDSKAVDEPTSEKILEQYELPESIQRQLPTLTISAHVYSSNPAQRSIIVNNEFFEEGDYIMDDIILHEITSDGAIFSYKGLLFRNRSVSEWQ